MQIDCVPYLLYKCTVDQLCQPCFKMPMALAVSVNHQQLLACSTPHFLWFLFLKFFDPKHFIYHLQRLD